jgi:hypothetical protein
LILVLNLFTLTTKVDVEVLRNEEEHAAEKLITEFLMRRPDFHTRDVHMGFFLLLLNKVKAGKGFS